LPSDNQVLAEASELGSEEESGDFGDQYQAGSIIEPTALLPADAASHGAER